MAENVKGNGAKYEIDMVHGPLAGKILLFVIPLAFSGLLQLFFNAADIIVVGRFEGPEAIAAVGSNSSLINLFIGLFIGLSVGVNVVIARYHGAGKQKECRDTVRAAAVIALFGGLFLAAAGVLLARPVLELMDTPEDVIGLAEVYLRIYFLGMPVVVFYNFGSAVLRGVGDTRRPLIYLAVAGVINVILNLIFVILFGLGVAGVALATIISQAISAGLILRCLLLSDGNVRLTAEGGIPGAVRSVLREDRRIVEEVVRVGLPAGMQSIIFSISNVLIQSSVNSFGSTIMAGNAAASSVENFVFIAIYSYMQASTTFVSANYGAGEEKRVTRAAALCILMVTVTGLIFGSTFYFFRFPLLSLYTSDAETIRAASLRMGVICVNYYSCGWMDTASGCLRGLGYSFVSTVICLIGSCLFRILWIMTVFRMAPAPRVLYLSYPISWVLTFSAEVIAFLILRRRAFREKRI